MLLFEGLIIFFAVFDDGPLEALDGLGLLEKSGDGAGPLVRLRLLVLQDLPTVSVVELVADGESLVVIIFLLVLRLNFLLVGIVDDTVVVPGLEILFFEP